MRTKIALRAVARVAGIKISEAVRFKRYNPLFGEELHIDEELINLEEALRSYQKATETIDNYPKIRKHLLRERKAILKHCLGLVARMLYGHRLPREYQPRDINYAIRKITQLLVDDARQTGYTLTASTIEALRPFMSWRQRFAYREVANPLPQAMGVARPMYRRLASAIPFL